MLDTFAKIRAWQESYKIFFEMAQIINEREGLYMNLVSGDQVSPTGCQQLFYKAIMIIYPLSIRSGFKMDNNNG